MIRKLCIIHSQYADTSEWNQSVLCDFRNTIDVRQPAYKKQRGNVLSLYYSSIHAGFISLVNSFNYEPAVNEYKMI